MYLVLSPKFGTNILTSPIFIPYLPAFFYNNLTACHKELHVFLELMDAHCVKHVIHQDILNQSREYILLNYFS